MWSHYPSRILCGDAQSPPSPDSHLAWKVDRHKDSLELEERRKATCQALASRVPPPLARFAGLAKRVHGLALHLEILYDVSPVDMATPAYRGIGYDCDVRARCRSATAGYVARHEVSLFARNCGRSSPPPRVFTQDVATAIAGQCWRCRLAKTCLVIAGAPRLANV